MNDFKTIAKTGKDFVIILFDKITGGVENTLIEVFLDGMLLKTYLCDDSDTSLTIQPLPKGNYTFKITQLANGNAFISKGDFVIVDEEESNSEKRHIPFYEKFNVNDFPNLVKFDLPNSVTGGNEIVLSWVLEPELFECIYLGIRKHNDSMKLIRNERLETTVNQISVNINELPAVQIYFEFVLKTGQIFGIEIKGTTTNTITSRAGKVITGMKWYEKWNTCAEIKEAKVLNAVNVIDDEPIYLPRC